MWGLSFLDQSLVNVYWGCSTVIFFPYSTTIVNNAEKLGFDGDVCKFKIHDIFNID